MADIILNIGNSGSGKTSGLRNLPAEKTLIIRPNTKSLSFPGSAGMYVDKVNLVTSDNMSHVKQALAHFAEKFKYFVIEDLNHYFNARTTSQEFISQNSGNAAFSKWNQFAADVIQSFIISAKNLPEDAYLIILAHTETKEDGTVGLQTSGKLLDSNLFIPGYVTYVLHSLITGDPKDPNYEYLTNANGIHLAKSPAGCLPRYLPNDMFKVLQQIESYKRGDTVIDVKWKE
jgi:hypothetical protein